jgi:hypothetical protein
MANYSLEDVLGGGQPVDNSYLQQAMLRAKAKRNPKLAQALLGPPAPQAIGPPVSSRIEAPQLSPQQIDAMLQSLLLQGRRPQ